METLKAIDNGSKSFFALTKSSDEHILGFYIEGLSVTMRWIKRRDGLIISSRDLTIIESELLGIKIEQTSEGIPKVNFTLDLLDSSETKPEYYLINDPAREGHVALFFLSSKGPAVLREAYVDLETSLAYCKCQKENLEEFVEVKKIDLGPISFFMGK